MKQNAGVRDTQTVKQTVKERETGREENRKPLEARLKQTNSFSYN